MDSYYELRYEDGDTSRLDGVNSVESAKAVAREVAKHRSDEKVELVKVTPIDPAAPARTRG